MQTKLEEKINLYMLCLLTCRNPCL